MPWALITGASGEIGQAIAMRLATQGVPLYLHYHQSLHKLEPLLAFCEERGIPAFPVQADLSDLGELTRLFEQLPVKPLLLVNNASLDSVGLFTDVSPELFDQLIAVNVRAAFFLAQLATPAMLREGFGRIVNVSSIWGQTGASCEVLYSMTKGALITFTKALAKELAPSHITVNAIAPGAVAGGMMNKFSPEEIQALACEIPTGRLAAPEEVASLVAYLLAEEASYITGQVIGVNGGWYT